MCSASDWLAYLVIRRDDRDAIIRNGGTFEANRSNAS